MVLAPAAIMWKLSETTNALLQQLHQLQRKSSWFRRRGRDEETISLLDQIGEQGEPAAVPAVARWLFGEPAIRAAACSVIHSLLSAVSSEQLLHLSDVLGWSWGWYISDAWDRLSPTKVQSLIVNDQTRTSILGLLSFHRNGYVRQEAVRLLAECSDGSELPYLLIRQNDWVQPIRDTAQSAVSKRLVEGYLIHFVAHLPLVLHLLACGRRDHSAIVRAVVGMLVRPGHDTMLRNVVRSSHRPVRRRGVEIALEIPGDHHRRVVQHGLGSDDAVLRLWCIRRVPACMPDGEANEFLERLQRDRFMPVRREALLIGADLRPREAKSIWQQAALDRHVSIRELGRARLTNLGTFDPTEFYRRALLEHDNSLAALEGLTETGGVADLPLIRAYLKSPLPSRRRAAVRGLGRLGGESVISELVQYLRDDSPSVFKAARQLLLDRLDALAPEGLYDIVSHDHRAYVRDNTLRLIFEIGKWRSLPWLIKAAAHEDESTSQCAQDLVERWFTPPLDNRVFTRPSPEQRRAIHEAMATLRSPRTEALRLKLQSWLNETLR